MLPILGIDILESILSIYYVLWTCWNRFVETTETPTYILYVYEMLSNLGLVAQNLGPSARIVIYVK